MTLQIKGLPKKMRVRKEFSFQFVEHHHKRIGCDQKAHTFILVGSFCRTKIKIRKNVRKGLTKVEQMLYIELEQRFAETKVLRERFKSPF